jgi:iron complex transport system ATP-binding protein
MADDMVKESHRDVPRVEIRNARVYRGDTCVFDRLDLTILQHETVAILGPNGSGKTTLLKLISRELYPVVEESASVRVLGRERWNVWELRSRIGFVSHDLQAKYRPDSSGLDVVLSGYLSSIGIHGLLRRRIGDRQRERAASVLRELGAANLADRAFGKMSTGQQRRCLLARALVHDPDTLILDEPTAGLDLAAAFEYLDRIRKLTHAGKNIILVCHSLNEIPPEVGRVVLLREGSIVADGPKDSVLTPENLAATYGIAVRLALLDGYYLAYPPSAD